MSLNYSASQTLPMGGALTGAIPSGVSDLLDDEPDEVMALVREPTDLNLPEEDVLVSGGTGDNEAMNGFYFKLSGTFGIPIYRLVKKEGFITTAYVERFLFKDPSTNCWIISSKSSGGISIMPGAAFAEDEVADRPGAVTAEWYVWYGRERTMKSMKDEKKALETTRDSDEAVRVLERYPIDILDVK